MANYWPNVWTDLHTAIHTAWSDISVQMRALQAERIDWKEFVRLAKITPPYAVIQGSFQQDPDVGGITATVYRGRITVYRIEQNHGSDIAATIEAQLKTLQDTLQDPLTPYTTMQVWDSGFAVDVTEANPVNAAMLGQEMPFSAGSLTFEIIFGEMP